MKLKKILSLVLAGVMVLSVTGCVNQHPEETSSTNESGEVRLVATSPAVAQICNRLNLDLVGICQSTSELPERYDGVTTVGMAMNPDLEIIKSLDPDYILSPATLQNDLQPKYASIGVSSLFLNLKSVEGMYASIEGLGKKFGREEEAAVMLEEFDSFMTEFAEKNAGKESPKVLVLMGLPGSRQPGEAGRRHERLRRRGRTGIPVRQHRGYEDQGAGRDPSGGPRPAG